MNCIRVLVDEDFGLKSILFNNPRTRIGSRGIIKNEGKIALFNKANKNEYKLPGGWIDEGAKFIWVDINEALKLISDCYENLKASEYENLYHSKFIVTRDKYILEYYIKKEKEKNVRTK